MSDDTPASIDDFIRAIPQHETHGAPPDASTSSGQAPPHTLLHFTLGARHYAIPGEQIREVIQPERITRLPGSPDYIRGVVVHRRSVIGVLDLERWLELDSEADQDAMKRLILVEHGELTAGICTGELTQIMTLTDEEMQRALKHGAPDQKSAPYVRAVLHIGELNVLLLHITRILGDAAIRH